MKNILKFELRKLTQQKSFYICTAITIIFTFIEFILNKVITTQLPELQSFVSINGKAFLSTFSAGNFALICGIFIVLYMCTDNEQQTIKNIYARGISKEKYYLAKCITVIIATTVMFFVTLLFSFILCLCMFDLSDLTTKAIGLLFCQYLTIIAYVFFTIAIASLFKKIAISLVFTILAPMILSVVLSLIDAILKLKDIKISSFWLDNILLDLADISITTKKIIIYTLISIIYIVVFFVIGLFKHKNQEI